jgi:hypothetical protein
MGSVVSRDCEKRSDQSLFAVPDYFAGASQ